MGDRRSDEHAGNTGGAELRHVLAMLPDEQAASFKRMADEFGMDESTPVEVAVTKLVVRHGEARSRHDELSALLNRIADLLPLLDRQR